MHIPFLQFATEFLSLQSFSLVQPEEEEELLEEGQQQIGDSTVQLRGLIGGTICSLALQLFVFASISVQFFGQHPDDDPPDELPEHPDGGFVIEAPVQLHNAFECPCLVQISPTAPSSKQHPDEGAASHSGPGQLIGGEPSSL